MTLLKSLGVFFLSGLCEISGGYFMWLFLKEDKPIWYGIVGASLLILFGIIITWQSSSFGRIYAAYGGIFVLMSILWAWKFNNFKPDVYDLIGSALILSGVFFIIYIPRKA